MNHFEERGNDENPSVTRNLYPIRIQDVTINPSPIRIQNVARNSCPTRTDYDGSPITSACAKKMKEASHVLIQAIWAQSTNLNNFDPYGAHGVQSGLKLIHLVQIKDLGPSNVIRSNLEALSPNE